MCCHVNYKISWPTCHMTSKSRDWAWQWSFSSTRMKICWHVPYHSHRLDYTMAYISNESPLFTKYIVASFVRITRDHIGSHMMYGLMYMFILTNATPYKTIILSSLALSKLVMSIMAFNKWLEFICQQGYVSNSIDICFL